MAEQKTSNLEREYVIPLRSSLTNTPRYKKTAKSVKTIKEFVAKHMRVPDRDVNKVKLDVSFNNELWFRGRQNPPSKVKVKVRKDGELVFVEMADVPERVKFHMKRMKKLHKKTDKKEEKKDKKAGEKKEGEEDPESKEEKAKSEEVLHEKVAQSEAKAQKHLTSVKTPTAHRKALKK